MLNVIGIWRVTALDLYLNLYPVLYRYESWFARNDRLELDRYTLVDDESIECGAKIREVLVNDNTLVVHDRSVVVGSKQGTDVRFVYTSSVDEPVVDQRRFNEHCIL
jgi:hypothetical protein